MKSADSVGSARSTHLFPLRRAGWYYPQAVFLVVVAAAVLISLRTLIEPAQRFRASNLLFCAGAVLILRELWWGRAALWPGRPFLQSSWRPLGALVPGVADAVLHCASRSNPRGCWWGGPIPRAFGRATGPIPAAPDPRDCSKGTSNPSCATSGARLGLLGPEAAARVAESIKAGRCHLALSCSGMPTVIQAWLHP